MTRAGIIAAILVAATAAHADDSVWDRATADPGAEAVRDKYRRELDAGNEDVQLAASEPDSRAKRRHVLRAITAYRNAITAAPDEPEAHYRLGITEYTYFLVCDFSPTMMCDPDNPDPAVMQDVADHWQRFTELAPLDVRGTAILFPRALLRTKLETKDNLLLAIADYEAQIDRTEATGTSGDLSVPLANLAETYMMAGRLDDAITAYERAAELGADISTMYGLAVALDRDGQGTRARQIISAMKLTAFEEFQNNVQLHKTFFVPEGEVYYYRALAEEALGMAQQAIVHWDLFVKSGAHPQFQPRAKHNASALRARLPRGRK